MATYEIVGMTCSHCVAAVTAELVDLPGVTDVTVDLSSATATVDGPVTAEQVRDAVREAGYDLAG